MAKAKQLQHVPIFVGSTFIDLQPYRDAVRDALHRLETVVRGMEYFGSKPGEPVEECLKAVRSCKIYIGVFGMRYGSIPEGEDSSMNHLEYDEAQQLGLPSLIYLIDTDNQPVLPKHVETGEGAKKLEQLKWTLRKKHMVSFFTTPDDLAAKILHDIPPVIEDIGAKVEGILDSEPPDDVVTILEKFKILPKRNAGKEVLVRFTTDGFRQTSTEECAAIGSSIGATVESYVDIDGAGRWYVYAEDELAERMVAEVTSSTEITARARTVFGVSNEHTDFPASHEGLLIKEILEWRQTHGNDA